MDTMKTGSYLAALRKDAGMTQQEAADRLGVSNKTISKWESGGGFPDIAILPALAELYGVTADDLLAGEPVRRAAASGGGQVEQYLARRGELRWRIGYAVAALCLLASAIFRGYAWSLLLFAAAAAALWIGWSRCSGEELRRRLAMLLPCAAVLIWTFFSYFIAHSLAEVLTAAYKNGGLVVPALSRRIRWELTLLLMPGLYALLRGAARRWSGSRCLLTRPYFQITAAGWLACVVEEIVCWIVILPPATAYAATSAPSSSQRFLALAQAYGTVLDAFWYLPAILVAATLLALAVTAIVRWNSAARAG